MLRPLTLTAALSSFACASASPGTPPVAPAPRDPEAVEKVAVEAAIARSLPELRPCYRRELALDPKFERHVGIQVFVGSDGRPDDLSLMDAIDPKAERSSEAPVHSLQDNQEMARCLWREIATWRLPATAWHGEVGVETPPLFAVEFNPTAGERPAAVELQKKAVPKIVLSSKDRLKACYDALLDRRDPDVPRLKVNALFVVVDRRLREVRLEGGEAGDAPFKECLLDVLRKLDFSAVPGPETFDAHFPFIFEPTDE
jgi:hypothetical protein